MDLYWVIIAILHETCTWLALHPYHAACGAIILFVLVFFRTRHEPDVLRRQPDYHKCRIPLSTSTCLLEWSKQLDRVRINETTVLHILHLPVSDKILPCETLGTRIRSQMPHLSSQQLNDIVDVVTSSDIPSDDDDDHA